MDLNMKLKLTKEQAEFVTEAEAGKNIICDACWGSGKTTALLEVYKKLSLAGKNILYLTYNAELKTEARKKFNSPKNNIHNYDSFGSYILREHKLKTSGTDSVTICTDKNLKLIPAYDVILIDEYQDINYYHSIIINQLCVANPGVQIIAVGDRDQKINSNCNIDVLEFFNMLYKQLEREPCNLRFSTSFRLGPNQAMLLSNIFDKPVNGVNKDLRIEFNNNLDEIANILNSYEPGDILILGANYGDAKELQNKLETKYPKKFNKFNFYSSISDNGSDAKITRHNRTGLDITYDKCKGLERDIVVLCDFIEDYWKARTSHADYGICKNLFAVGLTRAKKRLIICSTRKALLSVETLKTKTEPTIDSKPISISQLLEHKPTNLIVDSYNCLTVTKDMTKTPSPINVVKTDGLIDTSFIVGNFVKYNYFTSFNIDTEIEFFNEDPSDYKINVKKNASLLTKLKALAAGQTRQIRYKTAKVNISKKDESLINARFSTEFDPTYNNVQLRCSTFIANRQINGIADAVKDDKLYEFKFVNEVCKEHFIQCAFYMLAKGLNKGILWNIQNNDKYIVEINDSDKFYSSLVALNAFKGDSIKTKTSQEKLTDPLSKYLSTNIAIQPTYNNFNADNYIIDTDENFAVIDVETSSNNRDIISLGVVIGKLSGEQLTKKYYLNHFVDDGIFNHIKYAVKPDYDCSYSEIIKNLKYLLDEFSVKKLFAYNASFDRSKLFELNDYDWYDIMSATRSKVFNESFATKTKTGKFSYSAESVYRQLFATNEYVEKHIAISDAEDEFLIMCELNRLGNTFEQI